MKFARNWGRLGMKYNHYKMEDALDAIIDYRGKTPKKSESGIETLSAKSVKNGYIDFSQCYYISKEEYDKFMVRGFPQKGDILLTTEAPLGLVARLDRDDVAVAQRLLTLRGKKDVLDNDYLMYFLQSNKGQALLKARETGTTVTGIKQSEFRKIEIELPDVEYQKKIAGILRSVDEKIKVNSEINNNLQQQVQTLFADWLLSNSEFATEVTLGDVCTKVTDGSHFSPKDDPTSSIPMLSVKDMREFDFNLSSCKHICEDDYEKMVTNDCVPQVNDILVAKDGSYLKEIFICNEHRKLAILSSIAIFRPNTTVIHPEILLAFLKSPRVLREVRDNYVSGSALPRIVLKDFKKLSFALPNMDAQNKIAPLFANIREQIAVNVVENNYMIQLRDAILPKLMSGEIDVSEIDL